jgi:ABC-type transport system substrate-binding protein
MDALLQKITSTPNPKERKVYTDKLFRVFSEQQPQIQLVVTFDAAAAKRNVGNFKPSALGPKTHWNIESIFLRGPHP